MSSISLCMIVKNEADTLPRCLESVKGVVDEIVIVDTGSNDGTAAIASQYTDKVFSFSWVDDFSAARNFAFEQASMDYCMWLDADDVILEADREALVTLKRTQLPEADVVMLPYHIAFDCQGRPTFSYYRERILRRGPHCRFQGAVHEAVAPGAMWYTARRPSPIRKRGQATRPESAYFRGGCSPVGLLSPPGSSSTMPGSFTTTSSTRRHIGIRVFS